MLLRAVDARAAVLAALFGALLGGAAVSAGAAGRGGALGASVEAVPELPPLPAGAPSGLTRGVRVVLLVPDSGGDRAGLRVGDVILSIDGRSFEEGDASPVDRFRATLQDRAVGDRVELLVLRTGVEPLVVRDGAPAEDPVEVLDDVGAAFAALPEGAELVVSARHAARLLTLPVTLTRHYKDQGLPVPPDAATHPQLVGQPPGQLHVLARALVEKAALGDDTADLERRLASLHETDDGFRLADVRHAHRHPLDIPELAADVVDALAPQGAQGLVERLRAVARRDDLELPDVPLQPLVRGVSAEEHAAALERVLLQVAALCDAAFAELSDEERVELAQQGLGVGQALVDDGIYLHADARELRRRRNARVLALAARVRREYLYAAACSWARLADPDWLEALRRDLAAESTADETWILRRETPLGEIVFGGRGANRYRGFEPALVVDLGGDDVYSDNAGAASGRPRPAAAVLDLDGDDAYEATGPVSQGAGVAGVGLLVDVRGNDRYIGQEWSQGAGLLGVGALVDMAGDDTYRAPRLAQAVGLWGCGLLIDGGGDDRHECRLYSQGLGLPGGFGILHDRGGDDVYHAKGEFPTNYGTQGVFDSWSQGVGMGFRTLQSGGMGLLVDDGGRDRYEAGNFSQGGGYYYGWGSLHDRGRGDDEYVGSRYDQGFSAHQAVGTFVDEGGDERYVTRNGVIAGLAWDESVSFFNDRGGDDTYLAGFFSLGASAHNSTCLFVDESGSDHYEGARPGRAGGNDYHGGTSLSVFLDLGPGRDVGLDDVERGTVHVKPEHGLVADLPGSLRRYRRTEAVERLSVTKAP